jgi:Aspartyl/Asparaginyl beta-hydroxylase
VLSTPLDAEKVFGLYHIARRLPVRFDPAPLDDEVARLPEAWWEVHEGPYHDGGWDAVALWAAGGDRRQQRSTGGDFSGTEALDRCPAIQQVLRQVPAERNRVRLMRLRPGARILRHVDPIEQVSASLTRLHVPIRTSPDVTFVVNDVRLAMAPGELWHVDIRFPHEVHNAGDRARIHLVIDLIMNPWLETQFAAAESSGQGRLAAYFLGQSLANMRAEGRVDAKPPQG